MEVTAKNLSELPQIADAIISFATNEKIFLLNGEMAAGKTTFIKAICKKLGVTETISSPTYSIVNEYKGQHGKIYHFDFYRIKNEEEAFDIGFEEYLYSGAVCLIEWPEKVSSLLPESYINVQILIGESEERIFKVSKNISLVF